MKLGKVGLVCRFKPVHRIHAAMLRAACELGDEVWVGIGSSNKHDIRNPFTLDETEAMIGLALAPHTNYRTVSVPDLGHGPRWRAQLVRLFGSLDLFVTANDYVASLLTGVYTLLHPRDLIPPEQHAPIDGTRVRLAMARGEPWDHLVPESVAEFIRDNHLAERFRREFGLATLAGELTSRSDRSKRAGGTHVRMG